MLNNGKRGRNCLRKQYDPSHQRRRQVIIVCSNPISELLYEESDELESPRQWYYKMIMEGAQHVEGLSDVTRAEIIVWCQRQIKMDRESIAKVNKKDTEKTGEDEDIDEEELDDIRALELELEKVKQQKRLEKLRESKAT